MASNAKFTKARRAMRRHKKNRGKKRILRREGSTPSFPLDPEAAKES